MTSSLYRQQNSILFFCSKLIQSWPFSTCICWDVVSWSREWGGRKLRRGQKFPVEIVPEGFFLFNHFLNRDICLCPWRTQGKKFLRNFAEDFLDCFCPDFLYDSPGLRIVFTNGLWLIPKKAKYKLDLKPAKQD